MLAEKPRREYPLRGFLGSPAIAHVLTGSTACFQVQCCEKEKCNADDQFQNPKTWPTPTPTPTDSPWCNWNETNANNAVHGAVCGFWLVVTTCVLTVFSIEVH